MIFYYLALIDKRAAKLKMKLSRYLNKLALKLAATREGIWGLAGQFADIFRNYVPIEIKKEEAIRNKVRGEDVNLQQSYVSDFEKTGYAVTITEVVFDNPRRPDSFLRIFIAISIFEDALPHLTYNQLQTLLNRFSTLAKNNDLIILESYHSQRIAEDGREINSITFRAEKDVPRGILNRLEVDEKEEKNENQ